MCASVLTAHQATNPYGPLHDTYAWYHDNDRPLDPKGYGLPARHHAAASPHSAHLLGARDDVLAQPADINAVLLALVDRELRVLRG